MTTEEIQSKLFSSVQIKPMGNITGKIVAIYINEAGVQYHVRYIDSKNVIMEYFYVNELDFGDE